MKAMKNKSLTSAFSTLLLLTLLASCSERNLDELGKDSQYETTPEVFIDGFSGGEDFNAWGKVTNFNLDTKEVYDGTNSIRIDVPNSTDPGGSWAGGNIFTSVPRDLTGYDCLTFYAKSTVATTFTAGLGSGSKYNVSASLALNTSWTKYVIPIPNARKLSAMTSMFYYSANPVSNVGYNIYIDNVKYEKMGTLAHPTIQNTFSGSMFLGKVNIESVLLSVNLPNGGNQAVSASPDYFVFSSSNVSVATINSNILDVVGAGTANITAAGYEGALVVNSNGVGAAPDPTYPANEVLSIFSDKYASATIYDFWCGATKISKVYVGSNVMTYLTSLDWTCMVNFDAATLTGYQDASGYKYLHIDIMTPLAVTSSSNLVLNLGDYTTGSNSSQQIYVHTFASSDQLKWKQLDIPVSAFNRSKVGYITFAGANVPNLYVDNVYFHN